MEQSFSWLETGDSTLTGAAAQDCLPEATAALSLAILASSTKCCQIIRSHIADSRLAQVRAAITTNCVEEGDRSSHTLAEAKPDVIVIDLHDPDHAIKSLAVLAEAMPEATLVLCCSTEDPQVLLAGMRAGAQEFLSKPVSRTALLESLSRLIEARRRLEEGASPKGKIFSVISAKGGTGATSVSINLAFGMSELPETSVALVDLDHPMGDAAGYLGLSPEFTVLDALADTQRLDPVLLDSYMVKRNGVAILPGMQERKPGLVPSVEGLTELFEVLRSSYTHSVIDFAPPLDEPRLEGLVRLSSELILVLTPELPCLWRTDWLIHLLSTLGGEDKLRLVVNRSQRNDEIKTKQVESTLRHPVYWRLPNDYRTAVESINRGQPLIALGRSSLADSYTELARSLSGAAMKRKRQTLVSLLSF